MILIVIRLFVSAVLATVAILSVMLFVPFTFARAEEVVGWSWCGAFLLCSIRTRNWWKAA